MLLTVLLGAAVAVLTAFATVLVCRWFERRYVRPALVKVAARNMDLPESAVAARLLNEADWRTFEKRAARQWRLSRAERYEEWHRLRAWFAGYDRLGDS